MPPFEDGGILNLWVWRRPSVGMPPASFFFPRTPYPTSERRLNVSLIAT